MKKRGGDSFEDVTEGSACRFVSLNTGEYDERAPGSFFDLSGY